MRVNGFLSQVSGSTIIRLYDEYFVFVNDMSVNEYFDECYDASFKDYDIGKVSVQDNILCIGIRKADKCQLAEVISEIRDQLESVRESLDDFEEKYL